MNYRKMSLLVLLLAATSQAQAFSLITFLQSLFVSKNKNAQSILSFSPEKTNPLNVGDTITLKVNLKNLKEGDPAGMYADLTYFDEVAGESDSNLNVRFIATKPTHKNKVAKVTLERVKQKKPTIYKFEIKENN